MARPPAATRCSGASISRCTARSIAPLTRTRPWSDGAVEDLSSDDFNDPGFRARATYDVSPELRPFVDALIDTRRYDLGEGIRLSAQLRRRGAESGRASN